MPNQKRLITKKIAKQGTKGMPKLPQARTKGDLHKPGTSGRSGVLRCPDCRALYYDKHWHSAGALGQQVDLTDAAEQRCEECARAAKGQTTAYAGEVLLDAEFAPHEKEEVLGLVRNVGKRAMKRDPEDRIVRISEANGAIRVLTSENQLAVSIGKQVHQARKGGILTITWSHDDKPVRVHWRKG